MDQRILEFIGDLRRAEMRISPSEALDALAASTEIGLEERETFKSALATTLVKESRRRTPRSRRCSIVSPPKRAWSWTTSPN